MAPEVFRHEPYNSRVDVYSYSMIVYQLLEYRPPFADMDPVDAARAAAIDHVRPNFIALARPGELNKVRRVGVGDRSGAGAPCGNRATPPGRASRFARRIGTPSRPPARPGASAVSTETRRPIPGPTTLFRDFPLPRFLARHRRCWG